MLSFDMSICALARGRTATGQTPQRISFITYAHVTADAPPGFVVGAFVTEPPLDISYTLTDDQNSNLEIVGNEIRVGGALAVGAYALTLIASHENGWSQTITQTIDVGEPIPTWVPRDALGAAVPFVLDAQNNRGWYGGIEYPTEASMLAAEGVSGTVMSGIRTFGPYDLPGADNEFPGAADFSSLAGLSAFGPGGTITAVGGELELTSGGTGAGWRFNLPLARKAYLWRLKGRRGTATTGNIAPTSAINTSMTGGVYASSALYTVTTSELAVIVPSASINQRFCGARQQNGATGTYYFDDATLTEVRPFSLFSQTGGTVIFEGIADSSATDQVLFEIANTRSGQSGDRDYIRITRTAANGDVECAVVVNQSNIFSESLGTVASGETIRLALAWKDAALSICMKGSAPVSKASNTQIESHAVMRFAGVLAGNAWSGFHKGYYIPSQQPNWWLQHASSGFAETDIWVEGDSYSAGANGVSLSGTLRSATSRVVINSAVGGSTLAEVFSRLQAEPNARGRTLVIWDGSANGYASVAQTCNIVDQIVDWHKTPSKIVYVPSVAVGPSFDGIKSRYTYDMEAIRDYIATKGVHTFDPVPLINALSEGSAQDLSDISAGVICQSLLQDTVHLKQAAMTAAAKKVETIIVANRL